MVARRARHAVTALGDAITADIPAALRAIEVVDSLTTGVLGVPSAVVHAYVPNDNRSLLIQVFGETGENAGDYGRGVAGGVVHTDCTVVFTYNSVTGDPEADELFCWRWVDAICDLIVADPSLGDTVIGSHWTDYDRTYSIIDESTTRHMRAIGVEVSTC